MSIRPIARTVGIAVLAASLSACNGGSGTEGGETASGNGSAAAPPPANPVTPPTATTTPPEDFVPTSSGPRMTFEEATHDFGTMPETETRTAALQFRNTGDAELEILRITSSCGCTVGEPTGGRMIYASGESGAFEVTFKPAAPGDQKQRVTVITNAPAPNNVQTVMISATVQAFIDVEPRMIQLGIRRHGETHVERVTVSSTAADFSLDRVSTSNPVLSARIADGPTQIDGLTRYEVEVTVPPSAPWGGFFSWLELTGSGRMTPGADTITHSSKIRVQGKLFGDVIVEPDIAFRFGCLPGETFERELTVRHVNGTPFELDFEVLSPMNVEDIRIDKLGGAGGMYTLRLTARGGPIAMVSRARVILTTNVPGQERIEVPIEGRVREPAPVPSR